MANATNIFTDGVLIDLDISYWSGAKHLTEDDLGIEEKSSAFFLGKKTLVPSAVITYFRKLDSRARALLDQNAFKFPIGNARFITKKRLEKVMTALKEIQNDYDTATREFFVKYPTYKEEMRPIFRDAAEKAFATKYKAEDFQLPEHQEATHKAFIDDYMAGVDALYPPVENLAGKFSLDWSIFEIALPRMRKGDADTIIETDKHKEFAENQYRQKIQQKLDSFVGDVVKGLREETTTLFNTISSSINNGSIIKRTTIQKLRDYIDKFRDLNFVGDVQVEKQLEHLQKEILDKHVNEDLAHEDDLRVVLKDKLDEITDTIHSLSDINNVTGEYKRKIEW